MSKTLWANVSYIKRAENPRKRHFELPTQSKYERHPLIWATIVLCLFCKAIYHLPALLPRRWNWWFCHKLVRNIALKEAVIARPHLRDTETLSEQKQTCTSRSRLSLSFPEIIFHPWLRLRWSRLEQRSAAFYQQWLTREILVHGIKWSIDHETKPWIKICCDLKGYYVWDNAKLPCLPPW